MTDKQRLAALILGSPVADWIASQRSQGLSWRAISDELAAATDGQVTVEHETLRRWAGAA